MNRRSWWLVSLAVAAACSGTDAIAEPTSAVSPPIGGTTSETGPSDDLAPSQVTSATVPPPTAPGACAPTAVAVWTAAARPDPSSGAADVTIRIENDGPERCEIDIRDSPGLDPDIEFDAWLEPGDGADLWVDATADGCGQPVEPLTSVPLVINGRSVDVAVNTLAACEPLLVAFAPIAPTAGPCAADALAAVVTGNPAWLLVRNQSFATCDPGDIGAFVVDGEARATASETIGSWSASVAVRPIGPLAAGDIAGVRLAVDTVAGCERRDGRVEVGAAVIPVAGGVPDCVFAEPGPLVPYLSSPMGPLADLGTGDFDVGVAVALLDPFGSGVGS